MRSGTIAFLAGILMLVQCQSLPPASFAFLLPPLIICLFSNNMVFRLVACAAIGFIWALLRADFVLQQAG